MRKELGQEVNLEQIKVGLAWHYKQYGKSQQLADLSCYGETEELARLNGMGLGRDPAPVAPWDFRRKKRSLPVIDETGETAHVGPGARPNQAVGFFWMF
ncbi:MAG: nuclease (SNase-like) [Nitrosospira multiformis]|jgi:hypothetical protein|nr:nuclease (SNase-like) [Nitrosospira multiformis]